MNTLIDAPWTRLLGSSIHDPVVMAFLSQLHPRLLRATVTGLGLRYRVYPLDGLEFILSGERISDIHIHVEPSDTNRCWAGRLPLGLCRGMNREQVQYILGEPASSRQVTLGSKVIWVERWQVPETELTATFDAQGGRLTLLTLSVRQIEKGSSRSIRRTLINTHHLLIRPKGAMRCTICCRRRSKARQRQSKVGFLMCRGVWGYGLCGIRTMFGDRLQGTALPEGNRSSGQCRGA